MTKPRVDVFTAIHKGLRREMYETGARLERTNFADPLDKSAALDALERTRGFFDEHLMLEDRFFAPLVKAAAPPVLAQALSEQHRAHEELSRALSAAASAITAAEGAVAVGLGVALCKRFNTLVADQSAHMNLEEREANAALWAAYSDEQLAAARAEVQAFLPPPRYGQWLEIIFANANHQELVGMLLGAKQGSPPEAFAKASAMARSVLGERWPAIAAALGR